MDQQCSLWSVCIMWSLSMYPKCLKILLVLSLSYHESVNVGMNLFIILQSANVNYPHYQSITDHMIHTEGPYDTH